MRQRPTMRSSLSWPLVSSTPTIASSTSMANTWPVSSTWPEWISRAPMPWWRDGFATGTNVLPDPAPLRHIGIYGYRAAFLREFPRLPPSPLEQIEALEQLRALWHGRRIAVHVTQTAPGAGVDTPEDLARVRSLFNG